ncbi:MAG: hypothetical protein JXX28_14945 [Deltaproteobacteria bacterium]|nr:hypothetical protein [Deltaproteobacteria bacterium]
MRRPLLLAAVTATAILALWALWPTPDPATDQAAASADPLRAARTFALVSADPTLTPEAVDALLDLSEEREDLREDLHLALQEAEPTEAELRAFYEANAGLFGHRGLARSRNTVRELLAIRHAREVLDLPGGAAEVVWPNGHRSQSDTLAPRRLSP